MRKLFLAMIMSLVSLLSMAQQPADKIIGIWQSIDAEVELKFEIFKSGEKYFGKLLWASNMGGKTKYIEEYR